MPIRASVRDASDSDVFGTEGAIRTGTLRGLRAGSTRSSQCHAASTVVTISTPGGGGGRATITTVTPRSRATSSLASVAVAPAFLATSVSMACSSKSRRSLATVKGPRSRISTDDGNGSATGSIDRTRNH